MLFHYVPFHSLAAAPGLAVFAGPQLEMSSFKDHWCVARSPCAQPPTRPTPAFPMSRWFPCVIHVILMAGGPARQPSYVVPELGRASRPASAPIVLVYLPPSLTRCRHLRGQWPDLVLAQNYAGIWTAHTTRMCPHRRARTCRASPIARARVLRFSTGNHWRTPRLLAPICPGTLTAAVRVQRTSTASPCERPP